MLSEINKIAGWMAPNGDFIECALYEHMDVIRSHNIFSKYVPKLDDIFSRLDHICDSCQKAANSGEHPEWHCYEMACDNERSNIRRLLLNAGFIRIGQSKDSIHFEGRPNHLKTKHQKCKDFADSYGADAVFEPER